MERLEDGMDVMDAKVGPVNTARINLARPGISAWDRAQLTEGAIGYLDKMEAQCMGMSSALRHARGFLEKTLRDVARERMEMTVIRMVALAQHSATGPTDGQEEIPWATPAVDDDRALSIQDDLEFPLD